MSLSETPTTSGETFTAVVSDTNGLLSATASGTASAVSSNGGKTLTISGALADVNAVLGTLSDTDTVTPSDTILVNATDSNGGSATQQSVAVTVNGLPQIAVTSPQSVAQNAASPITGIALTEAVAHRGRDLHARALRHQRASVGDGAGALGSGTNQLTLTGSLSAITTALGTLKDTDASLASDTIKVNATDGFNNQAAQQTITVDVTSASGKPSIMAPATAVIGVGQAGKISGISITETPVLSGETFTAVLSDSNGGLSATASGTASAVSSNGGKTLTISGALADVNAVLGTLSDTDTVTPSDTILVNATDSNGGSATQQSVAVTVNGLPQIAVTSPQSVAQNAASPITGIALTEAGATAGETFTLVLSDTNGLLSATARGLGSGTNQLTLTGSLSAITTALGTLKDTDASLASDTIKVNATDGFNNQAAQQTITVDVTSASGKPSIMAPATAVIGVGQAGKISGISITETPVLSGETFTAVLSDSNGGLSATASGTASAVSSNGGKTLTISGALADVNAVLGTLSDTDTVTPSDTILVSATDSNGGSATQQSVAVTVNGLPQIAVTSPVTVNQNVATAISGLSLSETGNTSGETSR